MCFILMFVSDLLEMPPHRVPLNCLRDDLDDVREALANVIAVLQ